MREAVAFKGLLVKPLDQQADRDGDRIDPAGVTFDPEAWQAIHVDFNYAKPPVGRGKVHREEDGSLVVEGEIFGDAFPLGMTSRPKLAIGVSTEGVFQRTADRVIQKSDLMSISLTREHADPTQPPIVIGINRRASMNITRMGHYHTPGGTGEKGSCQWATVIKVVDQDPIRATVNLKVIDGDGDEERRLNVQQDDPLKGIERGEATFHLSTECPFGK